MIFFRSILGWCSKLQLRFILCSFPIRFASFLSRCSALHMWHQVNIQLSIANSMHIFDDFWFEVSFRCEYSDEIDLQCACNSFRTSFRSVNRWFGQKKYTYSLTQKWDNVHTFWTNRFKLTVKSCHSVDCVVGAIIEAITYEMFAGENLMTAASDTVNEFMKSTRMEFILYLMKDGKPNDASLIFWQQTGTCKLCQSDDWLNFHKFTEINE